MKKHYFLGLAAGQKRAFKFALANGKKRDSKKLEQYLSERYDGEAILTKNGRSGLAIALKAYFNPHEKIIVNGFTCYAVIEAIKSAKLTPVFADIEAESLNFNVETLEKCLALHKDVKGMIVQNTLGNPIEMKKVEKWAKKHGILIVEDLAHCVGAKYPDGREVGTVGVATALSFGKEKIIDTTSGGAVVLRDFERIMGARFKVPKNARKTWVQEFRPKKMARKSDSLRARFYPLLGAMCRKLSYLKLGGILMKFLLKIRFIERSADNKLDLNRKPTNFEAKLALKQFKNRENEVKKIREFYLLENRDEILEKLKKAGYYFDGFWYEKPVAPERYYKEVHFPEEECPIATIVAKKIINFPTYYTKKELREAYKIVEKFGEIWEDKNE